ncbi:MAG: hypothetical protein COW54_00810 [Rhodobacteraceae bacterium CG17_big_fil_post_rev_8_21_14_2_50_63_15]|nr:MAG: hypothetical protein COW54_00810 [Rhodobacteraceae bacterium CG17_big_fil_post_rev_8_21_14_2_50_63_15]
MERVLTIVTKEAIRTIAAVQRVIARISRQIIPSQTAKDLIITRIATDHVSASIAIDLIVSRRALNLLWIVRAGCDPALDRAVWFKILLVLSCLQRRRQEIRRAGVSIARAIHTALIFRRFGLQPDKRSRTRSQHAQETGKQQHSTNPRTPDHRATGKPDWQFRTENMVNVGPVPDQPAAAFREGGTTS